MPVARLTKTTVERAVVGDTDQMVWDGSLSGFGVKITPSGSRVYLVQYRTKPDRKIRRYTIGRHGAPWTAEKAREAAVVILAKVKLGEDPFHDDRARREAELAAAAALKRARAQAQLETFEIVSARFIELYAKPRNRSWREIERVLGVAAKRGWSGRSVRTIKRADIQALIDDVAIGSRSSSRVMFANLRKFFSWCVEREFVDISPCLGMGSPAANLVRDRWLSDIELKLVWRAAGELGWPFGPMYQFLILTAQRRSEVSGMRWSEVDLNAAEWTIPAERAKNGKAHLVDLSPEAVGLLDGLERDGELIFSTTGVTGASGHSRAKSRMDAIVEEIRARDADSNGVDPPKSPIPTWRLHDLRRTAATGMARLGNRPEVVEAVLNHISGVRGGLVAVYQHYDHRPERKTALLSWASHVTGLIFAATPSGDES